MCFCSPKNVYSISVLQGPFPDTKFARTGASISSHPNPLLLCCALEDPSHLYSLSQGDATGLTVCNHPLQWSAPLQSDSCPEERGKGNQTHQSDCCPSSGLEESNWSNYSFTHQQNLLKRQHRERESTYSTWYYRIFGKSLV